MFKYFALLISLFSMAACASYDKRYYSLHPEAIQKVIAQCPENPPKQISCEQLKSIALNINELALQLRSNPQMYGKKILALQELIAKQDAASNVENIRELEKRLAIVKWLESPQ